jgi:hypothetical protein
MSQPQSARTISTSHATTIYQKLPDQTIRLVPLHPGRRGDMPEADFTLCSFLTRPTRTCDLMRRCRIYRGSRYFHSPSFVIRLPSRLLRICLKPSFICEMRIQRAQYGSTLFVSTRRKILRKLHRFRSCDLYIPTLNMLLFGLDWKMSRPSWH